MFAWLYLKLWVKLGAFGPVPNEVWRLQGSAGTRRSVCSSADCIPVESCDDALNCPGVRPLATRPEFTLLKATFTAAHSVGFKHRFHPGKLRCFPRVQNSMNASMGFLTSLRSAAVIRSLIHPCTGLLSC